MKFSLSKKIASFAPVAIAGLLIGAYTLMTQDPNTNKAFFLTALLIGLAGGAAIYAGLSYVFDSDDWITSDNIKSNVRMKCPEALKILIAEKKKTAVKVGIFDNIQNTEPDRMMEIRSEKGVSDSVVEGQIYYL